MLFVFYDSSLANRDSNLYMKSIGKNIKNKIFLDVYKLENIEKIAKESKK